MIYLRAGLYAEGKTDYEFLLRLLDRLLEAVAAASYPGAYEVGPTIGIDAPHGSRKLKRAERITAAVLDHSGLFELLVIHADGAGDPAAKRTEQVDPAIASLAAADLEYPVFAVPCIPVREIEAWMLTDAAAFRDLLGSRAAPVLPPDPEREIDPKAILKAIVKDGGARFSGSMHAFLGERAALPSLRRLPAFQAFESELARAVHAVARAQGHRETPAKH